MNWTSLIAYIIGAIICGYIAFAWYKEYKNAKSGKQRNLLLAILLTVLIFSIASVAIIRFSNLSESLFPEHYQAQSEDINPPLIH